MMVFSLSLYMLLLLSRLTIVLYDLMPGRLNMSRTYYNGRPLKCICLSDTFVFRSNSSGLTRCIIGYSSTILILTLRRPEPNIWNHNLPIYSSINGSVLCSNNIYQQQTKQNGYSNWLIVRLFHRVSSSPTCTCHSHSTGRKTLGYKWIWHIAVR